MEFKRKIAQFFIEKGFKLNDGPELLDKYLYIDYWNGIQDVKLRMAYPTTKDDFLLLSEDELAQELDNMINCPR